MVLTVRQRGQLLLPHAEHVLDDVVATVWFEQDEESEGWGGILEPQMAGALLRAQVSAGQRRYRLQLEDGRSGMLDLGLSEFEADGERPLAFTGFGVMARQRAV